MRRLRPKGCSLKSLSCCSLASLEYVAFMMQSCMSPTCTPCSFVAIYFDFRCAGIAGVCAWLMGVWEVDRRSVDDMYHEGAIILLLQIICMISTVTIYDWIFCLVNYVRGNNSDSEVQYPAINTKGNNSAVRLQQSVYSGLLDVMRQQIWQTLSHWHRRFVNCTSVGSAGGCFFPGRQEGQHNATFPTCLHCHHFTRARKQALTPVFHCTLILSSPSHSYRRLLRPTYRTH